MVSVRLFSTKITLTIHLSLSIDPSEQYSLAAFAKFLTNQLLESILQEAIIESLDDVLVEASVAKNT